MSADIRPVTESEEEDVTSINFARLIKNYISPFARVEPQTALQYVYLVPLGSDAPDGVGERQRAVSLELVRDVVLASRAWGKLLGSVRADGSKEVSPDETLIVHLLIQVVDRSDREGCRSIATSRNDRLLPTDRPLCCRAIRPGLFAARFHRTLPPRQCARQGY